MIADSVEYIYDGEQMYYASETPRKELVEFIESLNQQQFSKMEDFFSNLPKLEKKIEIKCSRCGHEHKLDVEGLESFFG
jgi:folate-dependent tRNA-U54 methylase TrmFO/GidA